MVGGMVGRCLGCRVAHTRQSCLLVGDVVMTIVSVYEGRRIDIAETSPLSKPAATLVDMALRLAEYIEAGRSLDRDEREVAALALQEVEDDEREQVDAAWALEINRRVDEILNGEVELVDGEDTMTRIREMIASRRRR